MGQGRLKLDDHPDEDEETGEEDEAPDEYGSLDFGEDGENPNDWDPENWGDHENQPVTLDFTRRLGVPAFEPIDNKATLRDGLDPDDPDDLLDISGYGEDEDLDTAIAEINQQLSDTTAITPFVDYYYPEDPLPEDWTEIIITNAKIVPPGLIEELSRHPEIKIIRANRAISIFKKSQEEQIADDESVPAADDKPTSAPGLQTDIKNVINYLFHRNPNCNISIIRFPAK